MMKYFDWLVEHEKFLIGIVLVLVICLVVQLKFCKPTVETNDAFVQGHPSKQIENTLSSVKSIEGVWEMSVQRRTVRPN